MNIHLRPATEEDLESCLELARMKEFDRIVECASHEEAKNLLGSYLQTYFVVAEDDGEVIGFFTAEKTLPNEFYVDIIVVRAEYRKQGIGKKLMEEARSIAKREGYSGMYLLCTKENPYAEKFYTSLGMERGQEYIIFSEEI